MKIKLWLCLLALLLSMVSSYGMKPAFSSAKGQEELHEVELFSRIAHKESGYGKSAFSFASNVRSDSENWMRATGNFCDILYGNVSLNQNSNYFAVSVGGGLSRIKDLGELEWNSIYYIPFLSANPRNTEGIRVPGEEESFEISSEGRVTEAIMGHIYLAHIKHAKGDFYVMFRVDALTPNDKCKISWKLVPSPE